VPVRDISGWTHEHVFDSGNRAGERGTRVVTWITAATMVVEIVAGWAYNSMALLADGWHMSSHAVAIGVSAFAYAAARRYAGDPRFAFGTWKIEILGGFASAVFLLVVAALMVLGSVERLVVPQVIHYPEAMAIAALGLAVNLVSAVIPGRRSRPPRRAGAPGPRAPSSSRPEPSVGLPARPRGRGDLRAGDGCPGWRLAVRMVVARPPDGARRSRPGRPLGT